MKITYPRIIHSEMMTHRMFSRNSASSRAIPFNKMVKMVEENPFIPIAWQKNHKGMQGTEYFDETCTIEKHSRDIKWQTMSWEKAKNQAIFWAKELNKDGLTLSIVREIDGIESIHELFIQLEPHDLPIRFLPSYRIEHTHPKVHLMVADYKSGGPSGGLIQTLSIYASLLKLNIDQHQIAGTGSVSMDGIVGRIGAARQKIYTGIEQKIDVFFIPDSHYEEVKNIRISYQLVRVKTVREAVEWLYETYR
ncbi:MAG: hypothetical protein EOM23_10500 [Candidatus Moranbacteria bacterium]|nr:hypothetical protein [Candidatus Moranbacteria bacterium]